MFSNFCVVKLSYSERGLCNTPTKLKFQSFSTRTIFTLSNATNQPKSTVELGYMCPRGLLGPPAVTLTKLLKYEKRLLLRCIHHFISDLINNMDHGSIRVLKCSFIFTSTVFSDTFTTAMITVSQEPRRVGFAFIWYSTGR